MDAQITKDALNDRAEEFARWLFPAGRKNGNEWLVGSLTGESGKSLGIRIEGDKVGLFKDFASGEGGSNLVELFAQARKVPFTEALQACQEWLGEVARPIPRSGEPKPRRNPPSQCRYGSDLYLLTDQECMEARHMAETLASDFGLCERIARARGWKPETIRQLAQEVHLGWFNGKLAFIYDTGAKLRWREKGERIIYWAFGKPWLWRGAWISQSQTIYLCEGETDALTLIDAGIENETRTVVVALPSATTFNESWVAPFQGKDVILAFDNDTAGSDATAKVSRLLRSSANSLRQLNWPGLQYASAS